ncbi:hypothetical protein LCGC14_1334390 [marine sediment metagenome]|uniref:DUF819 family protein n=1 Tax=marine sediment metagenome TaxID=412755 RepID=A0A0F9MWG3_9ZZZZ
MTLSMNLTGQMTLGSALCLLVLAGCAHRPSAGPGSDHTEWGPASDGLQCSLAPAEKGLPFTLRIRNVGARGVRLHFDRYEPPRARSVINMPIRLDIRDRTGAPVLKLGEEPFGVLFTAMGILLKTDDVVPEKQTITAYSLAAALTYTFAVVALADGVVYLLNKAGTNFDFGLLRYLFITLLSVIAASAFPQQMKKLAGGQEIGLMLALVFFATISAGANISILLSNAPILLLFVLVILLSHGAMVFGGGFLLNTLFHRMGRDKLQLSLPELIIASNAAILGATTAPALAMARGWQSLITPGILVGVAGYIIGTPLGLLIASW